MLVVSFDEKAATFSNRVTQFIRVLHPYLVCKYIDEQGIKWTMHQLAVAGLQFETHKSALYAVDVTFQQTTAPALSFNEKKTYFSKKHGLYGHKVEVSVGPNGLAINVTDCAVGSTSDFEMVKVNLGFHSKHLEKQPNDNNVSDNDALKTLWGLVSDKYTWKKDEYNIYFQTCVVLTNVHVRFNPLRNVDCKGYNQHLNRLLSIGSKITARNLSSKAKYRENRKARIQAVLGLANSGYTSEDYDIGYEETDNIFD
ncbi:hypothetical protein DYB32_010513 [Aphanomyces invadans]|uniref:DDE Tnp4 domain-containing protein n=1 Tax=Aphanomyces invadans TaxID=157072 RepID=A0A3R6YWA7_9STRA|nr:hypothetical protein DYB32_010513 [Aphanomyces invadans]